MPLALIDITWMVQATQSLPLPVKAIAVGILLAIVFSLMDRYFPSRCYAAKQTEREL